MPTIFYSDRTRIKQWYISLLLGFLYIGLGIWMLRTPLARYVLLSIIFGASILCLGLFWTALSISSKRIFSNWNWLFTVGLVELIIGIVLILFPSISPTILPLYIGLWLIFGGIIAIGNSLQFKSLGGSGWIWLLVFGLFTALFSILLLVNSRFADIIFMTAIILITFGFLRVMFAFSLKKISKKNLGK